LGFLVYNITYPKKKGDGVVASYLRIFMAYGKDKALEKNEISEVLPSGVWDFHDNHQGIPMMRSVTLILGCCLVLIMRKGEWNELTGYSKDPLVLRSIL
jgi:hypothetical protein